MVSRKSLTKDWRTRAGVGLAALVVAGAGVAAIGTSGEDERGTTAATETAADAGAAITAPELGRSSGGGAADGDGALAAPTDSTSTAGGGSGVASVPVVGPKVIKTATISMEVGDGKLAKAVDRAASIAAAHGGFVEGTTTSNEEDGMSTSTLVVRVPADRFDAARAELRGLGKVESEELAGDDVSSQLVDYEARLRNLRSHEAALNTLMGRAKEINEILQVQGQLFTLREQIEQLDAQRAQLENAAALATLTVDLFEPGAATLTEAEESAPDGVLARSLESAVDGSLAVIGGMIVVLGYAIPLGAIALVLWLLGRLAMRRRPAETPPPATA